MADELTFWERISGTRNKKPKGDIELPNESGKKDPKLEKVDVRGQLKKAFEGIKDIYSESDALKGLQKAAQRK